MNDYSESSGGPALAAETENQGSAGSMLRRARETEGLQIAALAVSLKVPVNKIEALETDRLDMLPDLVFARALASSLCRALKIDAAPVLAQMPSSSAPPMKTDETGINAPFRVPGESTGFAFWRQLSKPLFLAVVVLLVGALVLLLPVFSPSTEGVETVTSNVDEAALLQPNVLFPPDGVSRDDAVVAAPAATLVTSEASPLDSIASVELPSSPAASGSVVDTSSPTIEGAGLSTGLLVLKGRDVSWVQVIDGAGVVQVRKTLQPGDVVGVSGVLPLSVVLGRADAVDVLVKGKPFEVVTRSKENIARFEVR